MVQNPIMKNLAKLFFSIILIAGVSACNQEEIDGIKEQIEELKSSQIASINTQIGNIQTSISSLEKMDAELKKNIEDLTKKEQELESTDEAQAKEIATLRETLTQLETSLSKRIDDLKTYVDEELKKQSDWVSATFSTLEQYQGTCTEIANIKQSISDLETSLKTLISGSESSINQTITSLETTLKALISDTESSIKSWVNEQLTGYYTIAQMDAKISALEKAITDGDDAQAAELDKLKTALETAKTDIKTAYEQAITDAITTSEGKINEKIAADIKTATDALQGQINEINTKISAIETRLGIIEASLEKILAQVQSIVVVPTYSYGRVQLKDSEDTDILFEVSPRSAAVALAQQDISVFSLDAIFTETKASMFDVHFPIKSVKDNGECLAITIDAANMDMEALAQGAYTTSFSARLKIDDGVTAMTTSYFTLYRDVDYMTYPLYSIRDLENQDPVTLGDGCKIKAEVISNSALNNLSSRLMFVQDYSAGLAIYCNAPHGYEFGDVLTIDLSNTNLQRYNGYLEVADLPVDRIKKIGHKDEIKPIEVSVEDFLDNKYESQYVAIKDVQVVDDDLEKTWVVGGLGTNIGIEQKTGYEFVVFSPKAATYGSTQVPQGSGTIKGISAKYNDTIQLLFAQNTDWTGLTETRFAVEEHSYTLSIGGADTKAGISDNQMVWKAGDKVFLSDGNTSVICSIPQDFDGQRTATVKTKRHLADNVSCIYPGDAIIQDGDSFYVDIPEDQGVDGSAYMVCSGGSTSNYIQLSPRTAVMKVNLSSEVEDLDYIKITVEGSPLVGRLKIDEQGAEVVSGTQSVKVSAHGDNVFYFSVLPGSITKLDLDIYKTNGSYGRKTASSTTSINAGTLMNLSVNPSTITYNAPEFNGLAFTSTGETSIMIEKVGTPNEINLEYSKDGILWSQYSIGDTIPLSDGDKIRFRAGTENNASFSTNSNNYYHFVGEGEGTLAATGNIMSLLDREYHISLTPYAFCRLFQHCSILTSAPELPSTALAESCYYGMFYDCINLSSAPELPATTLATSCYYSMFYGCINLASAPSLPATTLAVSCYRAMFYNCISLSNAPTLPATTLAERCYNMMFNGCSNLIFAPELPATALAERCYSDMFSGCSSLTSAPALPATTLTDFCYSGMFSNCTSLSSTPALPATKLTKSCYSNMFKGCSGLTSAPALPATSLASACYHSMFWDCSGLTSAPALPATTLASSCYYGMFYGCKKITTAPELPATMLAEDCYRGMFINCYGLTSAPPLPASNLISRCYEEMFYNCTSLSYVKALFKTTPGDGYTKNWLKLVSYGGTFVKASDATWEVTGASGIPSGWTVQTE